jgi:hypothetical protein
MSTAPMRVMNHYLYGAQKRDKLVHVCDDFGM